MSYVYIAKSKEHPGMVKIGRTDISAEHRMDELSEENYGPSGFEGEAEWEVVRVIKVENSVEAEKILHQHFSDHRVEENRELFYSDEPSEIAREASEVIEGITLTADLVDITNFLNPLSIVSIATGLIFTAETFFPENKNTIKAKNFMINWEERLDRKIQETHPLSYEFFNILKGSYKVSQYAGIIMAMPLWGLYEKNIYRKRAKNILIREIGGDPTSKIFHDKLNLAFNRFSPLSKKNDVIPYPRWVKHCRKCDLLIEKENLESYILFQIGDFAVIPEGFAVCETGIEPSFQSISKYLKENISFSFFKRQHIGLDKEAVCNLCFATKNIKKEYKGHEVDWYFNGEHIAKIIDGIRYLDAKSLNN